MNKRSLLLPLTAVFAAVPTAAYVCYRMAFSVSKARIGDAHQLLRGEQYDAVRDESIRMIDKVLALPYEDVWITSHDGLRLHGKYYRSEHPCPGPRVVELLFHGYRSMAERDFSGGLLLPLESGYDAILVDQRAHGESDGVCLTFGVKERLDCQRWVDYTVSRFGADVRILLVGISMGAATVLMASSLPLPENVRGILADCGYSSPEAIIRKVMQDKHYPVPVLLPFVRLGAQLFAGFRLGPNGVSAEGALTRCKIPVLFIHGEDDRFVPCGMSRRNYALCASEKKTLLTVPGAGHGLSFMVDNAAYVSAVRTFTDTVIK